MANKFNLTIDATNKYVKLDWLASDSTTVIGTDYFNGLTMRKIRDELDGWWFDRIEDDEFNNKIFFSQIVELNGVAIGVTTQAAITALLIALWE